jgi:hypothetical protein
VFLRSYSALFFIAHDSRRVVLTGCTTNPTGAWLTQQVRNLAPYFSEQGIRFRDRNSKYSGPFDHVFANEGIRIVRTLVRAPTANAIRERLVRTVRTECLDLLLNLNRRCGRFRSPALEDHPVDTRPALNRRSSSANCRASLPSPGGGGYKAEWPTTKSVRQPLAALCTIFVVAGLAFLPCAAASIRTTNAGAPKVLTHYAGNLIAELQKAANSYYAGSSGVVVTHSRYTRFAQVGHVQYAFATCSAPVLGATDCALSFKRSLPGIWRVVLTEVFPHCSPSPFPTVVLAAWKVCSPATPTADYYVWGNWSLGSPAHGTFDVSGTGSWLVRADTWSSWGGKVAVGHGRFDANLCKPDCAAGNFSSVTARIELSKPMPCKGRFGYTYVEVWTGKAAKPSYWADITNFGSC